MADEEVLESEFDTTFISGENDRTLIEEKASGERARERSSSDSSGDKEPVSAKSSRSARLRGEPGLP